MYIVKNWMSALKSLELKINIINIPSIDNWDKIIFAPVDGWPNKTKNNVMIKLFLPWTIVTFILIFLMHVLWC